MWFESVHVNVSLTVLTVQKQTLPRHHSITLACLSA
jgi:hypothetical protein